MFENKHQGTYAETPDWQIRLFGQARLSWGRILGILSGSLREAFPLFIFHLNAAKTVYGG